MLLHTTTWNFGLTLNKLQKSMGETELFHELTSLTYFDLKNLQICFVNQPFIYFSLAKAEKNYKSVVPIGSCM